MKSERLKIERMLATLAATIQLCLEEGVQVEKDHGATTVTRLVTSNGIVLHLLKTKRAGNKRPRRKQIKLRQNDETVAVKIVKARTTSSPCNVS